ncbi:MAG: hypothetical protein UT63_C0054G0001, partial [Candidatus Gottesmanbacteria bacterium GW2011_GWC2_39_8]
MTKLNSQINSLKERSFGLFINEAGKSRVSLRRV